MPKVIGISGLMPKNTQSAKLISCPPYDVMNQELETALGNNPNSIYHVILGKNPKQSLDRLIDNKHLVEIPKPSFLVYEQSWGTDSRIGVLLSPEVSDPKEGKIRDHEDVFKDKVEGRIKLTKELGYTTGPVFCITKRKLNLSELLRLITKDKEPDWEFTSDFSLNNVALSDLHGIKNKIYRISQSSSEGKMIQGLFSENPIYIADGHHRFNAALRGGQKNFLSYVTDTPNILAYNRLINANSSFEKIIPALEKEGLTIFKTNQFKTPQKGQCCVYTKQGLYLVCLNGSGDDAVGELDVSKLKTEIYPHLGLDTVKITDNEIFHYMPENELRKMKELIDNKKFQIAIAMHPIAPDEVIKIADTGARMPEKSTYFAPKILTGLALLRNIN